MNDLLLEKEAFSFRTDHGLHSTDPIRLKSLLQRLNVITVFTPLSGQFSGMAIKAQKGSTYERFMLVNSNTTVGKQHFTICHELYHLFVQPDFSSQVCKTGLFDKKLDKNEYYADIFASFLLLPTEGLLKNIPDEELNKKPISLRTILFIEHQYSCSRRALLYRLKSLNLIKQAEYDAFTINVKRGALENGFQTALYEPGNNQTTIGDYGSLARELYDKEKISQSHYYSLLTDFGIDITKLDEAENDEF
jgi:Zn-dependent peptidase ImmA (M78 family)